MSTKDVEGASTRYWSAYACARCGGMVIAASVSQNGEVTEVYPSPQEVDGALPPKAKAYLEQAVNSMHAPAGAVMLAASSVDAMLKDKGYVDGSLYARINKAKEDHLITEGMSEWAHEVRLDANDQRHADNQASLPSAADARHCIDFVTALGQFIYVLPDRVERGRAEATN